MTALPASPVVLITGCSSGIGAALAQAYHSAGCTSCASARRPEALAPLREAGLEGHALDVTDGESIRAAVAEIERVHGGIDLVVNNAGIPVMGPVAEVPLADLRRLWETNLTGAVAVVQAVAPGMMARGRGRIVNIGSVSGVLTTPFAGPYCASKGALHHLNDALRMELAPYGVEVLLVQPGAVRSGFGDSARRQTDAHDWMLYASHREGIARRAGESQRGGMPAPDFAAACVRYALAPKPRPVIRIGPGSGLLPRLARVPVAIRDRLLSRRFGLRR